jgi:DNA-binding MarR family transcriptional regulator
MSSGLSAREQLLFDLTLAMREVSGQGVLFSELVAAKVGVHSTDLECLDIIMMRGPTTAGALAAATGLTSGAITAVVDRLERAGLVRRQRDAEDRRKVFITTTPIVDRDVVPYSEPMRAAVLAVLERYRDADLKLLLGILQAAATAAAAAIAEVGGMEPLKVPRTRGARAASAP